MNPETDWLTAVVILSAGLITGLVVLLLSRSRKRTEKRTDQISELKGRLDSLVEQLRSTSLGNEERSKLEIETASLLLQIDQATELASETPQMSPQSSLGASALKGFAWGVASFVLLGATAYIVMRQATPKQNAPAMRAASPAAPGVSSDARTKTDTDLLELKKKVAADPKNSQLRNDLALAELHRDNLMEVFEQTKIVLQEHPDDTRALTLQAMVRSAMGEGPRALEMLHRAAKNDPRDLDARVALAWVYAQNGRMGEAEATIAQAVRDVPAEKELLEKILGQIKTRSATKKVS